MFRSYQRRKQQTGVASIEFAIGFFAFWLMCMAWVEMSYLSYVSAIGDLAISQAALHGKRLDDSTQFLADFKSVLTKSNSLWKYVADADDFTYSIRYVSSYDDLSNVTATCEPSDDSDSNSTECGNASGAAIAIYHISYNAPTIFNYFLDDDTLFSREAIVIQEYQRSDFDIN